MDVLYAYVDSSPINAAIFKREKGPNVVLRPQCRFDARATFLNISVCVSHFCLALSLFHTHTVHTPTHAEINPCSGQNLISLSDSLLALHPNGLVLHRMCI